MPASVFFEGPPAPCPTPFNLAEYVLAAGQATPDKIALAVLSLSGAERWSYAKLTGAVLGAATGLLQRGLAPGDRVLLRLGNGVAFPIAYLAALAAGLIPVPSSAQLTQREASRIARIVRPALIVAETGIALPEGDVPCLMAQELAEMARLSPAAYQRGDPERPGYIVFTSGTGGDMRAVTHAHRAIWARRMMHAGWYGLGPEDRLLHAGAFNWTYTLGTGLLDPWTLGATALIPHPDVAPAQLPLLMKRHDATILAAAPGLFRQVLRAPFPAMPRLRHGLSAGEKLPEVTRARWEAATGTALHEAYGMSECSTFISGSPAAPAEPGTLGRPQAGRHLAVLDPEGAPVPREMQGALAIARGEPGLMLGYWNPDRAAPDPIPGPWFQTGDQMSMTETGSLRFLGRGDDMLNAGGFRVSPIEVENALTEHPQIQECAAIETQIAEDTSIIQLFYVADQPLDAAQLARFASERLARYKQPRAYVWTRALPKGANGKILRRALRDKGGPDGRQT